MNELTHFITLKKYCLQGKHTKVNLTVLTITEILNTYRISVVYVFKHDLDEVGHFPKVTRWSLTCFIEGMRMCLG